MTGVLIEAAIRGSILALLAVGLTMVQGTLAFANVAHVEFATGAAFGAVALTGAGVTLWAASVLSVVGDALVAVLLYRVLFTRLLRSGPMMAMVGSLAFDLVVRAVFQAVFTSHPRHLPVPLEQGLHWGDAAITPGQVRLVLISAALLSTLGVVLKWTSLGRRIRAVAANGPLVDVCGINRARVVDAVWVISAGLAGSAGILLATDSSVSPDLGYDLLLSVFAVAIVGGLGSPLGAILAAYGISLVEALVLRIDFGGVMPGVGYLSVSYRPAIGFVALVLVLLLRPQGLMGRAVRRA
jgi:branched-subunit amino acid ABC-type transport system permease component